MGFCPQLGGVGPCPAQCIWQGSGFAADQTNAMLAVGGTSCISLISVAAADENSLTPLHRLLPAETASLGFGGSPVGGGDKNSRVIFFTFLCGGYHLPSGCCGCVGTTRRGVYFSRKNGFLRVGALRRRTRCSLLHTALFRHSYMGGGITTLGVRFMPLKRWTPAGHGGVFAVFMLPRNSPHVGRISPRRVHTPPQPLTAHTAAHTAKHGETRRVIRVDGDDVSGSGIIDTIDPFQADQTVAVALAEGHRNAVSP